MRDIAWNFHYSPSFIMTKTQLMCWLLGLYISVKYFLCYRATFCCVFVYCDLNDRLPSVLHDISLYGKGFPQLFISGVICTFYRFHCNLIMLLSYCTHWQDPLLHYVHLPVLNPSNFVFSFLK